MTVPPLMRPLRANLDQAALMQKDVLQLMTRVAPSTVDKHIYISARQFIWTAGRQHLSRNSPISGPARTRQSGRASLLLNSLSAGSWGPTPVAARPLSPPSRLRKSNSRCFPLRIAPTAEERRGGSFAVSALQRRLRDTCHVEGR